MFNVQGDVHIGGDLVNGDQFNTIAITTINNAVSPVKFVAESQKLKAEIQALKSKPEVEPATERRLSTVEGNLQDAVEEAGREKPVAERITSTLDDAKEMMDKFGGGIASAVNLGMILENLALMTLKVFGG
jgi:hypothetical protein